MIQVLISFGFCSNMNKHFKSSAASWWRRKRCMRPEKRLAVGRARTPPGLAAAHCGEAQLGALSHSRSGQEQVVTILAGVERVHDCVHPEQDRRGRHGNPRNCGLLMADRRPVGNGQPAPVAPHRLSRSCMQEDPSARSHRECQLHRL